MTIPSDGQISAEQIDNEFPDEIDGGKPVEMSEYFGVETTIGRLPSGVGTERTISFNNFKGVTFSLDSLLPTTLAITALDADKNEGNSGTTEFTFVVTRSGNITESSSVSWVVSGSGINPASPDDFVGNGIDFPSGSVSFSPGQATRIITINVKGDTEIEPTERFVVRILNPVNATITSATAIGVIRNDDAGSISISATDANKLEGDSGVTVFTFTVTRSRDIVGDTSVSWVVVRTGLNPADANDFVGGVLPSGVVTFSGSETTKTINIEVQGDDQLEPDETFSVKLFNAVGAAIDVDTAEATIINDDAVLSIAPSTGDPTYSLPEGNSGSTPFTFIVTRTGSTARTSSASWQAVGSGLFPASPDDFVGGNFPSGTVSFAPGQTIQIITVNVAGDTQPEEDESFTVTIFNPVNATISNATARGIILNDDSILSLTAFNADQPEGNSGSTPFAFTVTRSGSTSGSSSASWAVSGSGENAAVGADFVGGQFPSGTVSFAPGEITKTIFVEVAGDTVVEPDETFTVTLFNPVNASIGNATVIGVIRNDDTNLSIFPESADKPQSSSGVTPFTFTVTRTGDLSGESFSQWSVSGTGVNPATATDFQGGNFPSGSVSFTPGETIKTITINVSESTLGETDETFVVNLFNPLGATILIPSAIGNIRSIASDFVPLIDRIVPTQVFDVKTFGAIGNGTTDDTKAVQDCIDAARTAGNGAIAYFPKGTYRVTKTINIYGSNYSIGGAGAFYTFIRADNAVSPILLIVDPLNIRIEFIHFRHQGNELGFVALLESSDDTTPSRIHFDHVRLNGWSSSSRLFVNASDTPTVGFTTDRGMVFQARNLNANSVFTSRALDTQHKGSSFDNCSNSRILISYHGDQGWGALRIRGTEAQRNGFFGMLQSYICLRVEDNHSIVVSDGYTEQMRTPNTPDNKFIASPYLVLKGSPTLPPGKVTVSSQRVDGAGAEGSLFTPDTDPYETYITIDNYGGQVSHVTSKYNIPAGGDPNKRFYKTVCTGTSPVDVLLMGNTYEKNNIDGVTIDAVPVIEGGGNVVPHMLSNWNPGLAITTSNTISDITNGNTLNLASQVLDDFRELGKHDLIINYGIASGEPPIPTSQQISTYPELPILDWQQRSDWLNVKQLPSTVNGGISAVGDGIADDSDAILAACNEVRRSGSQWSVVYFPPGTYRITKEIYPQEGLAANASSYLHMRGHGRLTEIQWDGPNDGTMFRSDSNNFSSYIGIIWNGQGVAGRGFNHYSTGFKESKVLHQHEAFINFTIEGSGTPALARDDRRHLESSHYYKCIFINAGTALPVTRSNDFMITVDGCQFYDNNIGVLYRNGSATIRNSVFIRSSECDIKEDAHAPNSSIRRCSSINSAMFYQRSASTATRPRSRNINIQDCYISGWTNTTGAIRSVQLGANAFDPMLIFDCVFVNGPSSTSQPIRLDRPVQALHSNNKWIVDTETRTGAQLFTGNTTNIREIPFTQQIIPEASPVLSIFATNADRLEGNSGTTPFTFTVTRTGSTSGVSTVSWQVEGISPNPANSSDFQGGILPSGNVSFAIGETSKIITINVAGDINLEDDETFRVVLFNPINATISVNSAIGIIRNDDSVLSITSSELDSNVVEEFTTLSSASTNGWVSVGTTSNGNNYGWNSSSIVTGSGGCAGGIFARTQQHAYYADVNITKIFRNNTFKMAGSFRLVNNNFDGIIYVGYFNPENLTIGSAPNPFIGIEIFEPSGTASGPFRSRIRVNGVGGAVSNIIELAQNTVLMYDLTWSGGTDGSGTLSGVIAGQSVNILVGPGLGDFTAFGLLSGGQSNTNERTGACLFDNLLYQKGGSVGSDKPEGDSGITPFFFTVNRSGNTSGSSSATWTVSGSAPNPADADDFSGGVFPTGIVSFTPGQSVQTITINVAGDIQVEPDENFIVTLSNPVNASIAVSTASGIIRTDDAGLSIVATNADNVESSSGLTPFTFTVNRTGDTSDTSTASWTVTGSGDSPATAEDFQGGVFPSGTVSFAPGETSKDITVNVVGDVLLDPVLSVVLNDYNFLEGDSGITTAIFTISRSGSTTGTSSVSWQVVGVGTTNFASPSDFQGNVFPSGTVSFASGETLKNVNVNILGDTQIEADERFAFVISNPIGATVGIASTVATILNDDGDEELEIETPEPDTSIVQTFDTLASTTSAGWIGLANTSNGNDFGWNSSSIVTGSGGCIGGTFARSNQTAYFADASITELGRTSTLRMAGSFRLVNNNFDGVFYVGYFNPETITPGTLPQNFIGIEIAEPSGITTNPFRGRVVVNGAGGVASSVVSLPQNINHNFDLTWTGKSTGAGIITGALAGQSIDISATDGLTTFTAFGLLNGGFLTSTAERTGICLFDSLRYRKGEIPPPEDEPLPTLSIFPLDADKAEGNSGITTFTFDVIRQGIASTFSSALWTVSGVGTAPASANDFQNNQFPSGTVLFPSGQTNQQISVNVVGDTTVENTETFAVTLSQPNGATLGVTTAVGIIRNDDAPLVPTFAISPSTLSKAEGNSGITTFTFTVTRGVDTTGISTVQWDVTPTGTNPVDATDFSGNIFPSGSLTFSAGITTQNINVNVSGDTTVEPNETFSVNLKNPINGIIVTGTATGVITNDDVSADVTDSAFTTRANWMINSYANVTIGSQNKDGINGEEARKFGWAEVLSKLRINANNPSARQTVITRFVNLIDQNIYNAAFMTAGAAWILCKYWNEFSSAQKATLLGRFQAETKLTDHGTENHFLIRYVGTYLFTTQLWPNETGGWYNFEQRTSSGIPRLSSAQMSSFTRSRLLTVLRSLYDKGLSENLSTNYLSVHLYPLHALYSCAEDPEIKGAAEAVLNFHLANSAAHFFEGNTLSPFNRDSEQKTCDPQKNITLNTISKAVHWLYWAELMNTGSTTSASFNAPGAKSYGGEARHYAVTSALSDWRPSSRLKELAAGTNIVPFNLKASACNFGRFGTGEASFTEGTIYRDSLYALGSGNYIESFKNNNGLSQKYGLELVYKSTDDQNTIVIHHPYWRTNTSSGTFINKEGKTQSYTEQYPWLSRSSPFQQNAQYQSTVISLFNIPTADPYKGRTRIDWEPYRAQFFDQLIQQAWIRYPKRIDEIVQTSGWIFLRENRVYIAIRPCNGYPSIITTEFSDLNVVRSSGSKNAVIMDVATADEFSSFTAFRNTVLNAPLTYNSATPSVTYRNVRGVNIVATWGAIDTTRVDVKSFPTLTVNNVSQVMHDPDFIAARAVLKSTPVSLVNRILTVNVPSGQLRVDWRQSLPIITGI